MNQYDNSVILTLYL